MSRYYDEIAADSPWLHWGFDDDYDSLTVSDSAGTYDGTLTGAGRGIGRVGWNVELDGVDDTVRVSGTPSPGTDSFTLEWWWQRPAGTHNDYTRVLGKTDSGDNTFFALTAYPNNEYTFELRDDNQADYDLKLYNNTDRLVPVDTWVHNAAVIDVAAETLTLYENAVEVDSRSISGWAGLTNTADFGLLAGLGVASEFDHIVYTPSALTQARLQARLDSIREALVVSNTGSSSQERWATQRLGKLGYSINLHEDDTVDPDADTYDLIVIGETVGGSAAPADQYRDTPVPVISLELFCTDEMGLIGSDHSSFSGGNIVVTDDTHEVMVEAGLTNGTHSISTYATPEISGPLNHLGSRLANIEANTSYAAVVVIEAGEPFYDDPATSTPAKRAIYAPRVATYEESTAAGEGIFDGLVLWADPISTTPTQTVTLGSHALVATHGSLLVATADVLRVGSHSLALTHSALTFRERYPADPAVKLSVWSPSAGAWVEFDYEGGEIELEERIDERGMARFSTVAEGTAVELLRQGARVKVEDYATEELLFSGVLRHPSSKRVRYSNHYRVSGDAMDNSALADRRIVARSWENAYVGDIVREIVDDYLAADGVTYTASSVVTEGALLKEVVINYATAARALKRIAEASGCTWRIDKNKVARFQPWGTETASPLSSDEVIAESVSVKRGGDKYRNRQYVIGGKAETDPHTETFVGNGRARAFTVGYPIAKVPTVTVNDVAATVGIKGVDTGKDWYWSKGDPVLAQEVTNAVLVDTDTLEISYIGQYGIVSRADDQGEQTRRADLSGTSGLVERVDAMTGTTSRTATLELAGHLLQRWGTPSTQVALSTRTSGIEAGQSIAVSLPEHGIDGTYHVESVVATPELRNQLVYHLTLASGYSEGTWAQLFDDLQAHGRSIVESLQVGEDSTLIVLASFSEEAAWTEDTGVTVFACPVPSSDLYPDSTLYPC